MNRLRFVAGSPKCQCRPGWPKASPKSRPWLAAAIACLHFSQQAVAGERRLSDRQISQLEDLATRGQTACETKDFSACLDLFTQAQSMLPWPPHEFYLGEALVGRGRMLEGVGVWRQMIANNSAPSDPVVADAVELARQRLADVAPTIPTLLFQVPSEHLLKVNIQLDGRLIASNEIAHEIALDPGTHSVELSQPGYVRERHKLTLSPGVHQRILVGLDPLPSTNPSLPGERTTSWRVPVGWTLTGIGAGAMVGSLVVFLNKESLNRALEHDCGGGPKCTGLDELAFNQRTAEITQRTTFSNVLFFGGTGLALLGVSTLLWNELDGPEPPARLSFVTTPGYSALSVDGRF